MPFFAKLIVFWAAVIAILWLLSCFPTSLAARLAFSWQGPIPFPRESRSHLLFRWSRYALSWLARTAILIVLGSLATRSFPSLWGSTTFLVFLFGFTLLAGMAGLGACIALIAALRAKLFGPNPVFVGDEQPEVRRQR